MTDLLSAVAGGDAELAEGLNPAAVYLNDKQPADYTARITACGINVHDNPESPLDKQEFFRLELTVEEVNGPAFGSERIGPKQYADVELRPGDKVSTVVEMAAVGIKESVKKVNFRRLADFAALVTGNRAADYFPGRQIGPLGIRDAFGDGTEHIGKLVRVSASDKRNERGYVSLQFEIVPETMTAPAKKAAGKKAS